MAESLTHDSRPASFDLEAEPQPSAVSGWRDRLSRATTGLSPTPDLSVGRAFLLTAVVTGLVAAVATAIINSSLPGFRDTDDATRLEMVRELLAGRGLAATSYSPASIRRTACGCTGRGAAGWRHRVDDGSGLPAVHAGGRRRVLDALSLAAAVDPSRRRRRPRHRPQPRRPLGGGHRRRAAGGRFPALPAVLSRPHRSPRRTDRDDRHRHGLRHGAHRSRPLGGGRGSSGRVRPGGGARGAAHAGPGGRQFRSRPGPRPRRGARGSKLWPGARARQPGLLPDPDPAHALVAVVLRRPGAELDRGPGHGRPRPGVDGAGDVPRARVAAPGAPRRRRRRVGRRLSGARPQLPAWPVCRRRSWRSSASG